MLPEKFLIKFVQWDYFLRNLVLWMFRSCLFYRFSLDVKIRKLLIFRTGSIGDSICSLPAIDTIRKNFPEAEIHLLTNAGSKNYVSINKLIDPTVINKIVDYSDIKRSHLFKLLKKEKYDLFIELPQVDTPLFRAIRNMLVAKFLKVKYAFGWKICVTYFLPKIQEKYFHFENETIRLLNILKTYGLQTENPTYILGIGKEDKVYVKDLITKLTIEDKSKNIGIAIGAKFPRNRWKLDYYREISNYLVKQNFSIVYFGSSEDFENCESIKPAKGTFNLCGKLAPLQSMELMKNCSLIITNDSGPLHMAYSVNANVLSIFSCREYKGKWYPPENDINKVIRQDTFKCSICVKKACENNLCMQQIVPEIVIKEINNILKINI